MASLTPPLQAVVCLQHNQEGAQGGGQGCWTVSRTHLGDSTVSGMARQMRHTTRRQLEPPCLTPALQFYLPALHRASLGRQYVLVASCAQITQRYCTQGCEKHCALHLHSTRLQEQAPWRDHISTIQQLSSLSASCSHLHNAAHLILKPLLAWGKNLEVWSKQCLHQNVTSSDFQHLKFTISIEKAGFYKSSLQILKFSFPELHEWCYACSRKQRSMKKSPSERYKTATLKLLRLW